MPSFARPAKAMVREIGEGLEPCLLKIQKDFPSEEYALPMLRAKFHSFLKPGMSQEEKIASLVKAAVELTAQESSPVGVHCGKTAAVPV